MNWPFAGTRSLCQRRDSTARSAPSKIKIKTTECRRRRDETKRGRCDTMCFDSGTTERNEPARLWWQKRAEEILLADSKWGFSPVQNGRPCTGRGAAGGRGQSREQSLNFGPCCCLQPPPLFTINEFQNQRLPL